MLMPVDIMIEELGVSQQIDIAAQFAQLMSDTHGQGYLMEHIPALAGQPKLLQSVIDKRAPTAVVKDLTKYVFTALNNAQESAERLYRDYAIELYRNNQIFSHKPLLKAAHPWYLTLPDQLTSEHYRLQVEFFNQEQPSEFYDYFEELTCQTIEGMDAHLFKDFWLHDALFYNKPSQLLMPTLVTRIYEEIISHFGLTIAESQRVQLYCLQPQEVMT